MKTIKQIADEIGVTKQAVQKRLSREPLCTCLSPYISTDNGTKYIDETGESIIKQAFAKNESIEVVDNCQTVHTDTSTDVRTDIPTDVHGNVHGDVPTNVHGDIYGDIIKILQENLSIVQKQLDVKDKQIEELTETVRLQAESINADRKNELAETLIDGRNLLSSGEPDQNEPEQPDLDKKKKTFLQRIFKK